MAIIYGVNTEEEVAPLKVRDAMVKCFAEAHCADAGISQKDKPANRTYCMEIVQKAFADSDGDFENPTKESIMASLEELKKFAANFRDPSIIQKHYSEIMQLVEKLE